MKKGIVVISIGYCLHMQAIPRQWESTEPYRAPEQAMGTPAYASTTATITTDPTYIEQTQPQLEYKTGTPKTWPTDYGEKFYASPHHGPGTVEKTHSSIYEQPYKNQ
ncbi:MAG TPA: hypothetical protein VGW78_02960 [Candidatus Babeliales bacterium]|jgi:hypothetical protein|nr:hypothetical protein [Candidatus Babeliales bacterium]